ncbi:MAG TPA: SPFH domain-containing protein [Gemmatimonadales bacterium]|nr:SPFH domain-containing protein [Gemmatimonadales bacterium]
MGSLLLGGVILVAAFVVFTAAAGVQGPAGSPRPVARLMRLAAWLLVAVGAFIVVTSTVIVIDAGQVGVRHAFGEVDPRPLLPGVRFVTPWSDVERFSTREEQFPRAGAEAETISALSSEQMGMQVDVAVRWQIDPMEAPRIFSELGSEEQIQNVVLNAIRNGVRDGMVQYSINDISKRNLIAGTMGSEVDSALVTQPRGGGAPFRIATVTAFFLRDLQPPPQVVQAINNKIAQEQQIATERHRVEVARLQAEQQRLLNQTLTAEALTKQYLEVLHDLRTSSNLVLIVPTEGGMPVLDIGELRKNLTRGQ